MAEASHVVVHANAMALLPFPLNLSAAAAASSSSRSSSSYNYLSKSHCQCLCFLLLQTQPHFSTISVASKFRISCSNRSVQVDTQQLPTPPLKTVPFQSTKKKRKPKPSFYQQIQDKWSMKIASPRQKFPWQQDEEEEAGPQLRDEEEEAYEEKRSQLSSEAQVEVDVRETGSDPLSFGLPRRLISAPWSHGTKPMELQLDNEPCTSQGSGVPGQNFNGFAEHSSNHNTNSVDDQVEIFEGVDRNCEFHRELDTKSDAISDRKSTAEGKMLSMDVNSVSSSVNPTEDAKDVYHFDSSDSVGFLSNRGGEPDSLEGEHGSRRRSNMELAERMLPQHELQRLRNVSLRMLERTKVGVKGITKELVDTIHDKWKLDEVVKLKFEEPLSLNMKRTHAILEVSFCTVFALLSVSSIVSLSVSFWSFKGLGT